MKKIVSILAITLALVSCKDNDKKPENQEIEKQEVNYTSVGMEINDADALPAARMAEHYKAMKVGDTVNSKMIGKVEEVCQSKGCWMKVDLENGEQVMVKFKDYAFFMPKDLAGKEVVLNGKAFVNEVPVDEQRHYAEDGGATPEEIAAITAPKKTFSFEADGVLIKQ
ncbi:DUF4920 domain-containing protein [Aquaticitalea lipolytica]|uniref:DUF4920 domain-containing protein n=1 Tax=Aquaticitalea lipolytica TaxID=1247562 RepID=UPI0024BBE3CD|nr:DUF4920 domain-containing protein [Aquaticitalea lipolytica]